MSKEIAVGIDLGTTNSAIAFVGDADRVEVIVNDFGKKTTPSVVQFPEPGMVSVGWEAKQQIPLYPEHTAQFFKRHMGTDVAFTYHDREWTPATLSAEVLKKLKADAEAFLNQPVCKAVITVPAYFRDPQRRHTEEAARLAGLEPLQTIDEPTAAAMAYGADRATMSEKVLIYDLGGGTFDISIADVAPGSVGILGHAGNASLGGKDWDDLLLQAVCTEFEERHGTNPLDDAVAFQELLLRIEELKKSLTSVIKGNIVINYEGTKERVEVTRDRFEELTRGLMAETDAVITRLLDELQIQPGSIDKAILAGGSTRMPMVAEQVRSRLGTAPSSTVNPDECVAHGAAIHAHNLLHQSSGKRIGPGESAGGMAIAITRETTAHSLGLIVESADGSRYENSIVLKKHTPVPAEASETKELQTAAGRDNTWDVYLMEGDSTVPLQNEVLGRYTFHNVPHYDGRTRVTVTYQYNENKTTAVTGIDEKSGSALDPPEFTPPPLDIGWSAESPEEHARQAVPPIAAILCIDVSGSMSGRRLAEAKAGAIVFHDQLGSVDGRIGLVKFDHNASLVLPLSEPGARVTDAIQSLDIGGGTSVGAGLRVARDALMKTPDGQAGVGGFLRSIASGATGSPQERKVVVVLTDGETADESGAISLAKDMRSRGIEIVTIGTGGANKAFLRRVASADDLNVFAEAGELCGAFGSIARNLTQGHLKK